MLFEPGAERVTLICRCGLLVSQVVMVWRQWAHQPECQHTAQQVARARQLIAAQRWASLTAAGQVRRFSAGVRAGRQVRARRW